jgi:hypothetical protein
MGVARRQTPIPKVEEYYLAKHSVLGTCILAVLGTCTLPVLGTRALAVLGTCTLTFPDSVFRRISSFRMPS